MWNVICLDGYAYVIGIERSNIDGIVRDRCRITNELLGATLFKDDEVEGIVREIKKIYKDVKVEVFKDL